MARQTVTDEPAATPEQPSAQWLMGYESTAPASADSPKRASYEPYRAPGQNAVDYKKKWQGRPSLLPFGEGDEGSF